MEKLVSGAMDLGLALDAGQVERFETFYRELVEWNRRVNLTAITAYDEVQVKHFLDSLTLTLAWGDHTAGKLRFIDVGTGAGIPGIPLKILLPEIRMVLLDSTAKKAVFLRHIVGALGLSDVEVVVGRAEDVAHQPEHREKYDVVLSRAVASLPVLVELTLPFAAIGGCVISPRKGAVEAETARARKAMSLLGGELREIRRVGIEGLNDGRRLVIVGKVGPTPPQYPRRAGMPAKRPLIDKRAAQ